MDSNAPGGDAISEAKSDGRRRVRLRAQSSSERCLETPPPPSQRDRHAIFDDYLLLPTADYGFVPHPCLLRCKDNHMLEMSSEWSPDFFLPIISVLKDSKNTTAAYALTEDIC
uniref:Uncharacterized protein n=1 Tax=Plectus sambesii TaxID=2011161 RepID=A0A914ULM9_9BILA